MLKYNNKVLQLLLRPQHQKCLMFCLEQNTVLIFITLHEVKMWNFTNAISNYVQLLLFHKCNTLKR
jgi:hypothetical protein